MAAVMSSPVASSDTCNQNNCDLSESECLNCASLVKQLHSALEEIESAK
jgi:hypothetical protein